MSVRVSLRLAAVLVASAALSTAALPSAGAAPAVLPDPGDAALAWIEDQLADDGGHLNTSFDDGGGGAITVPDHGLTLDAVLALAAAGRGDEPPALTADQYVEDNLASYISGADFGYPAERYAGPIAKAMLVALIQGEDPSAFGGFDLEEELRARLQTTGDDAGRFSDFADPTNTFGGDFSNGFGQALAIMALDRTPGGVPPSALAFLRDQQCPGGGFRGNYSTPGGCTDDASATVDATGFALMALVTAEQSCQNLEAVDAAIEWLLAGQNDAGAFGGESGTNTNSTGVAAVALRSLGETAAADDAVAFISSLQLESGDDLGALSLNAGGEASAADGVQILERDGFRRVTTQGVLAFGLPTYAEIGATPVDPDDFLPCITDPAANLSVESIVAGGSLTITGVGFDPGETVEATLLPPARVLGSATADEGGEVEMTVTVPSDVEPGEYTVAVQGTSSGTTVELPLTVTAPAEDPQTLPATGRATGWPAAAGVSLIAAGLGFVALVAASPRIGREGRSRLMLRVARLPVRAVVAALVLAAGILPGPAAATPARRAAACPAAGDGVTVVVDFGTLSGGVQIRCVTEPVSSGFDALVKAGFTFEGTKRFPGLLCRIDGRPADDPCVNAPPDDRYWAYWTATEPGAPWTYSDLGAGTRTPPPGSVEGWAFSDGCTRAPQGPACSGPAPTTTTRPATTTTRPASGGGGSPTTTTRAATTDGGAPPTATTAPGDTTSTTEPPPGGTAPEAGEGGDEEVAAPVEPDGGRSGGSPVGALVGVGVAGSLAAVALVSARRRRLPDQEGL